MHFLAWVFFGYTALPFARGIKAVIALRRGDRYEYSWWDAIGPARRAVIDPQFVLIQSLITVPVLIGLGIAAAVFF